MKIEEAIKWLKDIHHRFNPTGEKLESEGGDVHLQALDMAIEALSREQKKYDAILDELLELKSDLNLPIEVAMAYEKSIGVVRKYAKMGGSE